MLTHIYNYIHSMCNYIHVKQTDVLAILASEDLSHFAYLPLPLKTRLLLSSLNALYPVLLPRRHVQGSSSTGPS